MAKDPILNLSGVPRELVVLLEIMRIDKKDITEVHCNDWFSDIDWNKFFDLSMHHRIFPLIYSKIRKIDEKLIPRYVVQTMSQQYKQNTFRMLHMTGEMEQLSRLFSENYLQLLILKGPVLSEDLYGDLSLRTCGDLDVMVSIKDLEKVDQLLCSQGYVKDDYIQTVLGDWKWRHHHITYFHSQTHIKLEIHWRLNPGPGLEPTFKELWERRRVSPLTSHPVYYLGREDLFLFLVTHGARHGWSRLRWLTDINRLLKQEIDWTELIKLLKQYHYLHIGGQALILSAQLLNSPLPKEALPLLKGNQPKRLAQEAVFYFEHMVSLHSYPVPEDIAEYHKKHLFSLMPVSQKFFFLLSYLFPYPEDAETLPLPKQFHFLYFPLRPFLWAVRKARKYSFRRRLS